MPTRSHPSPDRRAALPSPGFVPSDEPTAHDETLAGLEGSQCAARVPARRHTPARAVWCISVAVVSLLVTVTGCSSDDASNETLPPMRTTTTSTPRSGNASRFYEVKAGDSLTAIAKTHGTTVDAIMERNAIANPDDIHVGQVLELPLPMAPSTSPDDTTSTSP
jgi:LysM repeat protein